MAVFEVRYFKELIDEKKLEESKKEENSEKQKQELAEGKEKEKGKKKREKKEKKKDEPPKISLTVTADSKTEAKEQWIEELIKEHNKRLEHYTIKEEGKKLYVGKFFPETQKFTPDVVYTLENINELKHFE